MFLFFLEEVGPGFKHDHIARVCFRARLFIASGDGFHVHHLKVLMINPPTHRINGQNITRSVRFYENIILGRPIRLDSCPYCLLK